MFNVRRLSLLFLILMTFLFVPSLYADWVTDTVSTGDTPVAICINPITNKIYVVNEIGDDITIIDGETNSTNTLAAGAVRTLVSGVYSPGQYTVSWNGKNDKGEDLPSGIYFCLLEAGSLTAINKLIRIK